MQLAVAVEVGNLIVDVFGRLLIGNHVKLIELVLMFVEERRIEVGNPESREVGALLPGYWESDYVAFETPLMNVRRLVGSSTVER